MLISLRRKARQRLAVALVYRVRPLHHQRFDLLTGLSIDRPRLLRRSRHRQNDCERGYRHE